MTDTKAAWEAHEGDDYTVVMAPGETTDNASIQVFSNDPTLAPRLAAFLNDEAEPIVSGFTREPTPADLKTRAVTMTMRQWGRIEQALSIKRKVTEKKVNHPRFDRDLGAGQVIALQEATTILTNLRRQLKGKA